MTTRRQAQDAGTSPLDVQAVSQRLAGRLAQGAWEERQQADAAQRAPLPSGLSADPDAAAEVAAFALGLSGQRKAARRGGRLSRLVTHFALAAAVVLGSAAAACEKPTESPTLSGLLQQPPADTAGSQAVITAPARAEPARYTDLVLLDTGPPDQRWALLAPVASASDPQTAIPVLVDRQAANFDRVGGVYALPAQAVAVGTRDGASEFLSPVGAAEAGGSAFSGDAGALKNQVAQRWADDERFAAVKRAINGQPTVLDAAYNASAAVQAGGTFTYANGVVLRVEPDKPVVQVTDKALLESGKPLRPEDVVYVAIRNGDRALYEPGTVVTLRNVVMEQQQAPVQGQDKPATFYVANAALEGARMEPNGKIDLQAALNSRLQRTDQAIQLQAEALAQAPAVGATGTPRPAPTAAPAQQTTVIREYRGPSLLDDFLIWTWLSNTGYYRGPSTVVVAPYSSPWRGGNEYYYVSHPSAPSNAPAPNTTTPSQSVAVQAARSAVSGQAAGTGGGTAATLKSASDNSARVSAATSKASSVASDVSSASAGKSTSSVTASRSSSSSSSAATTAARSAGSTSVSPGRTSSSGSSGVSSSSSSSSSRSGSSGFGSGSSSSGGKGIGGASSGSSSS